MTPLTKHAIQITVLDDSSREKCDAACGVDWSSAEALDLASQRMKDRFGEEVRLTYLDLAKAMANALTLKWKQAIKDKGLSLPLLLINGKFRISGEFDIRQLLDAIEAEIEIGA